MKIKPLKAQEVEMEEKMNTIIGKDSVITGTIEVKGPLRVDGKIKGEVHCADTLTVGAGGELEAETKCRNAVLGGRVKGNIFATEKIELQAKAEINGDLKTKSLVIEQGAIFCGSCNMKDVDSGPKSYAEVADKVRKDQTPATK